jgi:hypothetical protein
MGTSKTGTLKIERIGGLAGIGLPGSKVRSTGETTVSALSEADRAQVESLFRNPGQVRGSGLERDALRYRITRSVEGRDQTIEVPEAAVPAALKACVTDKLM